MLYLLSVIALAALLAPALTRVLGLRAGWLLTLAPLTAFVWFVARIQAVAAGGAIFESLEWVPALGIRLGLRLDGLALLFALLISGIGALIVFYAGTYLRGHPQLGRFYTYLLLFMLAMLGLVLADDMVAMFVFWELTTIASFLLISFLYDKAVSRRSAQQSLLITAGGGLALLAGLILLGGVSGRWQFSNLDAAQVEGSTLLPAIVALVLLGCFTKSAQVPFHLWLPNAMDAPTPVSAYLHSATMVKAGIYLLARLNPVLGGAAGWGPLLIGIGAATALTGALVAMRQTDLKRLLAYTTVTVLGQLTMLIGTNTSYGLQAFVLYVVAHSLYKGALFMAVGSIDHVTGTREVTRLGGLIHTMPLTGAAVALAAFSNAGLPPFFGFIAKEFQYTGLMEMGGIGWAVTLVMILTNALLFATAGLVFVRTFLGPRGDYPRAPHEVRLPMWLGPMLLAIGGLVLGAWNAWSETWLVNTAVQAVARGPVDVELYLWGGITPAVVASLVTMSLGVLIYHFRDALRELLDRASAVWDISSDLLWDRLLKRVFLIAELLASRFQHGSLRQHLLILALAAVGLSLFGLAPLGRLLAGASFSPIPPLALAGCLLALAGGAAVAVMPGRLVLVAALGSSGLGLALVFAAVNAPDVAMTQLMVETLGLVFLALVLRDMPRSRHGGARAPWRRRLHIGVAVLFGLCVSGALLLAVSLPLPGDMARWYLENSVPGGHGENVVNVILVDFRAFDTLGEILVLALSALAAATLLGGGPLYRGGKRGGERGEDAFSSPLLHQGLRPLAWLLLAVSALLLWRGHNLPGGGFVGGLVAACGLILLLLTFGRGQLRRLLPLRPAQLIGLGLGCAALAGVLGLLAGQEFLRGLWWVAPGDLSLGSPLLFDLGVFLTVFGSALHMLERLAGEGG
ncbi:hydrogen gas-evolving membrane-bound hydrogenase subunit E [Microbulbifer sp.]|uniref:hydrogen gas-evolving membrane-bound hydrogenase subunit E n=1 Tax=Microbulbifer sp. TaxID=1908541 RepID=UPI003F314315